MSSIINDIGVFNSS